MMAASAAAAAAQAQAQAQAQAHAHAHAHHHQHHQQHPPLPPMPNMPMPPGWGQSSSSMSLPPPLVSNLSSSPSMMPTGSGGPSRPSSAADADNARRTVAAPPGHLGSLPPPMFGPHPPSLPQGSSHSHYPPFSAAHSTVLGQPYPVPVYGFPPSTGGPVQLLQGVGRIHLFTCRHF
jgi:hypothetical protein